MKALEHCLISENILIQYKSNVLNNQVNKSKYVDFSILWRYHKQKFTLKG